MKNLLKFTIIIAVLISPFFITPSSFAAFSISSTPYEGGNELIFRATPGTEVQPREVQIRIITDQNKKYEVRQELISPPANARGERIANENLLFRGLIGTNKYGTFQAAGDQPRNLRSINPIYTSSTSGQSDSFILVYNLNVPMGTTPGSYRGQLRFQLNPLVSGITGVPAFINVVVEVGDYPPGQEAKPIIEISPIGSLKTIKLATKNDQAKYADVEIKINGKFKNMFSIVEVLTRSLASNELNKFSLEKVNLETTNLDKGMGVKNLLLSANQQTIYTSGPGGEADSDFALSYSLGDVVGEKAGRYTSNIQYYLKESGQVPKLITSLDLEIENERLFELILTPENQKGSIEFRNLKPMEKPKANEVTIEIKSNLGKQYQVSQNVLSDLTSIDGSVIPSKNFNLYCESLDTKGAIKFPEKREVEKGDSVLFVSDRKGSSDKFKVTYELTTPWDAKGGDYSTRITYSLLEL